MFPGINPKKMQAVMRQMGINQEEIDASRVVIEKTDGNRLVIDNPSVTKINMRGQESFQISGNISEETEQENEQATSEQDIQIIMEKTGVSEDKAKKMLEETNGDLAEAILKLS